ncbi:MAG: cation:proton antiporter, partial [Thermoguttaceae bacterium]
MREHPANMIPDSSRVKARRVVLVHASVLSVAVGLFLLLRAYGETLATAHSSLVLASTAPARTDNALLHLLLALAVVVVVSQGLGRVFARCGQPRVIGEVVAGILLGPSLLGAISPASMAFVLPLSVVPLLGVLAQTGVIVYMFLVGLDLNASLLRSRAHASVAISHASIVAPFVLGTLLALWLYPHLAPDGVRFTSFALFMGVAMAITAFPVLARILTDQGLEKTELGVLALGCAAVDDVTAWCLLALSVGVAQSNLSGALRVVLLTLGY